MHQRKSKKIFIYFFLLIIFSSINNGSIGKIKLNKVDDINISGLSSLESEILLKDIKSLKLGNIFSLDDNEIIKIIDSNTLIEKYKVFKKYPSTLNIEIEKTYFLARINHNNEIFILGSNGKLSKNNKTTKRLPYIFGNPDIIEFLNLKRIIDKTNISYDEIKNFYFFKSKRWDLELKNNTLIKLSRNNLEETLNNAYTFLDDSNLSGIKIIDARINNQIILNDWKNGYRDLFMCFA